MRAVVIALALAACGPAPSKPEAPPAPPVAAAAAPAETSVLSAANLVGRWGDNGDCSKDIVINANGTFHSYTGGAGRWSLNGDRLTMTGENGTYEVRVAMANTSTLLIGNADGSFGLSQRC